MIAALYERHNDAVGNRAFEFDASFHTIRNDIRVLELKYPIYTRMGAGGGVFVLDSCRLRQRWLDSTSAGTAGGCVQRFR